MDSYTFGILNKALGMYALILTIVGTLANAMVFYICSKKKLRLINTFKFFSIMSITDTLCLYQWNLKHFVTAFYHFDLNFYNLFWCRFSTFLQYTTLQYSAWILVSISLDRLLTLKIRSWKSVHFKGSRVMIYAFVLALLIFILNIPVLVTNGYSIYENGTETVLCYAWYNNDYTIFTIMGRVHLYTYSIFPFCLLFIINLLVIYVTILSQMSKKTTTNSKAKSRKIQMTVTIIIMAISFILMTLPGAIVSGYFYLDLIVTDIGPLIIALCDNISFSYNGLSFFMLLLSNKQITNEFKTLLSDALGKWYKILSSTHHINSIAGIPASSTVTTK